MTRVVFEFLKNLYEREFNKNAVKWGRRVRELLKEAFENLGFKVLSSDKFMRIIGDGEKFLLLVKVTVTQPTVQLTSEEINFLKKAIEIEKDYDIGVACLELRQTSYWKIGQPKFSWLKPGPFNPDFELKVRWKNLEEEVNVEFENVVRSYYYGVYWRKWHG